MPGCSFMFFVRDKDPTDPRAPKAGDVITVKPQDWGWSDAERGVPVICWDPVNKQPKQNPNGKHSIARVAICPLITENAAQFLLTTQVDTDPLNPNPNALFRLFYIDRAKILASAPAKNFLDHIDDNTRANGTILLNYTGVQLRQFISQRDPVPAP